MTTDVHDQRHHRRDRRVADMPAHDLWRCFNINDRRKADRRGTTPPLPTCTCSVVNQDASTHTDTR